MKKTILLGTNFFNFPNKLSVWASVLAGIVFISNGAIHIYREVAGPVGLVLGIMMIPIGLGYCFYGAFVYNKSSRYAPRFSFDAQQLLFKKTLSNKPITFDWDHIKKIEMPYRLTVSVGGSYQTLDYRTSSEISKEIKSAIREMAESKNIEIAGG